MVYEARMLDSPAFDRGTFDSLMRPRQSQDPSVRIADQEDGRSRLWSMVALHPPVFFAIAPGLAIVGNAGAVDVSDSAAHEAFRFSIAAGKFDEYCMKIERGHEVGYRFQASGAVDFNIHHHRGSEVSNRSSEVLRGISTRAFAQNRPTTTA
jgi:hypothetical protein